MLTFFTAARSQNKGIKWGKSGKIYFCFCFLILRWLFWAITNKNGVITPLELMKKFENVFNFFTHTHKTYIFVAGCCSRLSYNSQKNNILPLFRTGGA